MIDLNPSVMQRREATAGILSAIDAGLTAEPQKPRPYLGASALGHACDRAIQLDFIKANNLPGAPEPDGGFSGKTLRIFGIGHALEELAAGWLRKAGYVLKTHGPDGKQFGFAVANGRFAGHCDGVIISGPDLQGPALWEHKAVGPKSWNELAKKGVTAARPAYAAQMSLYQAYLELPNPALFMATNHDTAEIHLELVPFDPQLAQAVSDKAVRILQATDASDLMPKAFAQADHFECRFCHWRRYCWP